MRGILFWLLLPLIAGAQIAVEITGRTATQAVLQIRGATSPCTIDLHEGGAEGPLHPDVRSSADTSRPDTITWGDGTRLVTLGHQRSDLALAADTEYTGIVSGCGSGTFQFRTALPALGMTMPYPLPANAAAWNNTDFPQIDFSSAGRDKWYVDPATGVKIKLVNRPEDFSRKRQADDAFPAWAGGSGWTDPAKAASGSTSNYASTSSTTPLFLYVYPVEPYQGFQALENVGLIVFGNCSAGAAEDCAIDVGLTTNPADGFAGTPIRITLPSGSVARVPGGSAHPAANGAFPTSYPEPGFAGWGVPITRDQFVLPSMGTITTAANGELTIGSPDRVSHFQKSLAAGNHIWIQDSGCTNNGAPDVCSIAAAPSAGAIRLTETDVNGNGKRFRAFPWGIMVRKVTAFGTVNVGFRYRWAGSVNASTAPGAISCGPVEVTDADGVKGHPCVISGLIYFISNDGEVVRPVMALGSPPELGTQFIGQKPSFSPTDGNILYVTNFNGSNLYRLTYRGDWKTTPWETDSKRFYINAGGDYPWFSENVDWEPALGTTLGAQVETLYPDRAAAPFSSWASGVTFGGISGDLAVFYRTLSGQDGGPCHVAVVNIKTGKLTDFFSTLEDGNAAAWGNCHSIIANQAVPNTVSIGLNILNLNNPAKITGGPYAMPIEAVMVNGSWVEEKDLPWPMDDSYDNQCPADLPAEFVDFGASGSQCVTLRTIGQPCNIAPSAVETNASPLFPACTWNPAFRMGPRLRPGHTFVDAASGGAAPGDSEHFRVLSVEEIPDSGGRMIVRAQRNATRDYCCIGYPLCMGTPAQQRHKAKFIGLMVPGSKASCNSSSLAFRYPDGTRESKTVVELSRTYQGHSTMGHGPEGTLRYVAGQSALTVPDFEALGIQPPVTPMRVANPKFNGVTASIGSTLQQYLDHSQAAAADEKTVYSFDANAINPALGIGGGNNFANALQSNRRTLEHVTGDIWTTTVAGQVSYKYRPLLGWSAQKALQEISGPSSDITSAPDYSFCYAYKNSECYPDSSQGAVYLKVPKVYRHSAANVASQCQTAMVFANAPCVVQAEPAMGYVRQFRTDRPDPAGSDQRLITSALRPAGTHLPFWGAVAHPAGNVVLVMSGGWIQGVRESVLLAKLPPYPDKEERHNSYSTLTVQIGPRDGMTQARVRFGYNTSFECTGRRESCVTDEKLEPFAFDSEASSAVACSGGCSIEVPAIPGRLLYYRVEGYYDSSWANGDTMTGFVE